MASAIAILRRSATLTAQIRNRPIGFMRNRPRGLASHGFDKNGPNCLRPIPWWHHGLDPCRARPSARLGSGGADDVVDLLARHFMPRTTGMSNSRIFLRKVFRLRPSRWAALI